MHSRARWARSAKLLGTQLALLLLCCPRRRLLDLAQVGGAMALLVAEEGAEQEHEHGDPHVEVGIAGDQHRQRGERPPTPPTRRAPRAGCSTRRRRPGRSDTERHQGTGNSAAPYQATASPVMIHGRDRGPATPHEGHALQGQHRPRRGGQVGLARLHPDERRAASPRRRRSRRRSGRRPWSTGQAQTTGELGHGQTYRRAPGGVIRHAGDLASPPR